MKDVSDINVPLSGTTIAKNQAMGESLKMKKSMLLAMTMILSTALLAACGGNNNEGASSPSASASVEPSAPASESASPSESASAPAELGGKLKVLTHRTDLIDDGTMDKYAEAFKAKVPNAELEFEGMTNYANDINVRLTRG